MSDILKGYGIKKVMLDVYDIEELSKLKGNLLTLGHSEDIDLSIIDEIIKHYQQSNNNDVL